MLVDGDSSLNRASSHLSNGSRQRRWFPSRGAVKQVTVAGLSSDDIQNRFRLAPDALVAPEVFQYCEIVARN